MYNFRHYEESLGEYMKSIIALLSIAFSANSFAYSAADSTVLTSAFPMLMSATTSGILPEKLAAMVLNDAQDLIQNDKMSVFLNQKIKEVQAIHKDASEEDALDLLINAAETILK
jgi:hypothetical protein